MNKLVAAVGTVIREDGYQGLTPTNIALKAGLHRKLIYLYFDSLDALIETYIKGKDYFAAADHDGELMRDLTGSTRHLLEKMLMDQLDKFLKDEELRKIILWQLSEHSQVMYEVAEQRERLGETFFELANEEFNGTPIDLPAATAILVAGIYYLVLHAKSTASLFCGINIHTDEGLNRIKAAISKILSDTYPL